MTARTISVAMVLISLSVVSCGEPSREPLHLRTSALDYRSLGLTPGKIQRWEDGRRTVPDEKSFEWWYFDALMGDRTAVVVVFSDNFAGDHKRVVSLELTTPDGQHRTLNTKYDEPGVFEKDHTFVKIGENRFEGDLDAYSIKVSADNPQHLGVDLVLKRRLPSFRAATGQLSSGPAYFAWLNAVPDGTVTGTITIGGKAMATSGDTRSTARKVPGARISGCIMLEPKTGLRSTRSAIRSRCRRGRSSSILTLSTNG
jgi:hypothetical protein